MTTLIKNCRVISPDRDLAGASIVLNGDRIQAVVEAGVTPPHAGETVDGSGLTAFPGFIDIHTHGVAGFDVMEGTLEAIEKIAAGKLREGVTTFCPTTLSTPEERLVTTLEAVEAYNKNQRYAQTTGVHLEGPYIHPDFAGAHNREHLRNPDSNELKRLLSITKIALVTFAVELEGAERFLEALCRENIVPSLGHSSATSAQFNQARKNGLMHITHFCNRITPLHHRDVGLVGAGLLDHEAVVELICDQVHLSSEMIDLVFRVKPIDTIVLVTDSTSASGLGKGDYTLGSRVVHVERGQARLVDSGDLAGSVLPFNQGLKAAQAITGLPLHEIVKTTSWNQARSLGIEGRGKIEVGFAADLALLDSDFEIKAVWVNGKRKC